MMQLSEREAARLLRYQGQSLRLLTEALHEARQGRWLRAEELLWGALTLAVKGIALTRGDELDGQAAVEEYARGLGRSLRDRRIRDAFDKVAAFADTADRVRESHARADRLVVMLEDVASAIERLWDLACPPPPEDDPAADEGGRPPPRSNGQRRNGRRRPRRNS